MDGAMADDTLQSGEEKPDCRVILSVRSTICYPSTMLSFGLQIDVQIATYHLLDHIEWDLLSPLTPEAFAVTMCQDLGLSGEAAPLIAHAIHEELMKHKKDAVEWGVIGGDSADRDTLKDKTGLGYSWGRAPKDGRGPKPLKSVWRDWAEQEDMKTRFEELTQEDVDRRELEKERATRRLRRETSKFQNSARNRRR